MIEDHRRTGDPLRPAAPVDDGPPDAVEIWGKRVGRALGATFAVFLIWRLIATYVLT
jgi:hypothetical protein